MARTARSMAVEEVVRRGQRLGMRPVDLLVGILQPTLYEVGQLWEQGKLDARAEAGFTTFSEAVLDELTHQQSLYLSRFEAPPVVLMNARWNRHTLGLRMAAFLLRERGIDARTLWPTPPTADLPEALAAHRPSVVGVSLATEWQARFLDELLEVVKFLTPCPRVVAGGAAVQAGCRLPAGVEAWGSTGDPLSDHHGSE